MALVDDLKWSDDPRAYRREWVRRKRTTDEAYAEKTRQSARDWYRKNPLRSARAMYRRRAIYKGLHCTLSDQQLDTFFLSDCVYCGAAPSPINGIDRCDNSLGYVDGNCVTACKGCNYAKRERSQAEFAAWISIVAGRLEAWRG